MKLGDKIPVPELDELRIARIERAIVAEVAASSADVQVRSPRSLRNAAYAMVAVAAVVLAVFFTMRSSGVKLLDRPWSSSEPTQIVTGPGQSSSLRFGDASVVIGESTQLSVERFSDGRTVLHLDSGSVDCEVTPKPHRPTFQVVSGDVTVTVIGTAFEVTRSHIVEVKVERGIVSVDTSHDAARLHAGDAWQGSPFAHTTLAALLAQQPSQDPLNPQATHGKDSGHSTQASASKSPGSNAATKPSKPGANANSTKNSKGDKPGKAAKTIKLSEVLLSAKPLPPIYKKSHNDELAKLKQVASRNPKRAVKELESYAAKARGAEASFALYARAYLLFFKLKDNAGTIKTAKQYARRFPSAAEAEDMLWLRVRASCAAEKFSSCRTAAHTYLRRYPKGIFQGLASRIVTTTKTE